MADDFRPRGFQGVDQQHGDGHGAHAAGHRGDPAGHFLDAGKVHVAAELAFVVAVHAHVDHHGAGLDHVGGQHIALAHGGDDHIGLQRHGLEVGVALWQMVTVAFFCSSISAMGLPTMLLRPITTACLPRRS
jgi:hypothetical protein